MYRDLGLSTGKGQAMNTRPSQLKIFIAKDGSVHKEIGPVTTESLVFEGGGIRGLSYIGATKALFASGIMHTIKRVAGTSAGAVTAAIVAMGYQQEDIERLQKKNDMAELMETKKLFTRAKISRLIKHGYLNEGDKVLEHCRKISRHRVMELIKKFQNDHAGDPCKLDELDSLHINAERATFQDLRNLARLLPDAGIKDLYIIAAKIPAHGNDTFEMKIFSAEHTPNVEIALVVRASVSIPKLFKPVKINGNKYVDGGCINNFPVDIFDSNAYKPDNTYMFQGSNGQNFSTLGIKIDTRREVKELMHAPETDPTLKHKIKSKMIDTVSGLPISHHYDLTHQRVRNHYSHRSCQLSDEGIKTTQFDLSEKAAAMLMHRGYEDMKTWIENYHNSAIESRHFSSFAVMCEMMSMNELNTFCEELETRPQDILWQSEDCSTPVAIDEIGKLLQCASNILEVKIALHGIIRDGLPVINAILRKYNTNLPEIYSTLDENHEVSEEKKWGLAAEKAVKIILNSSKNNFIKKDDVMRATQFIEAIKDKGDVPRYRGARFFDVSKKIERFSLPLKFSNANRPV